MRITRVHGSRLNLVVMAGAGALALGLVPLFMPHSPELIIIVPVILAVALFVVLYPFAGLFLIVLLVQFGSYIEWMFPAYASWILEAVGALTLLGVFLNAYRAPRLALSTFDLPALRLVILFAVVLLLSFLFADDHQLGMTALRKFFNLLVMFGLILYLVNSPARIKGLVLAIVLSTAVSASLGVLQYGKATQVLSTFSAADELRHTIPASLMLVGIAMAALLAARLRCWRLPGVAVVAIGLVAVIFTFSRSATIVFGLGLFWLILKFRNNRSLPGVLALVALLAVASFPLVPQAYWNRLGTLVSPEQDWTLGRRLGYNLVGLDLLISNPVLGVGPNNFPKRYTDYEYRWMPGRALETRALHNLYLSVAVETGLLGFVLFAAILLSTVFALSQVRRRSADREMRIYAEATQFAYVLYLIGALVQPADTNKYTWILIGLAAAISLITRSDQTAEPEEF